MFFMRFRKELVWIIGIVLAGGLFFYQTILFGRLPVPSDSLVGLYHPWRDALADQYPRGMPFKNFLITDPIRQQIPWRKIVIDQWKKGKIPLWNPFSFSGSPLAANIQAGAFYPLNIFFFALPFPAAWTLIILFQPVLAGVFLYVYLRHRHMSQQASFLGAVTWSFSGFSIAWLTWGTIVHAALWLPVMLLSLDKLIFEKARTRWFFALVCAVSFALFAGHMQVAFYVILAAALYAVWQLQLLSEGARRRTAVRTLLCAGAAVLIITSIQWVPLVRLVFSSGRLSELENWTRAGWFMPWQHLVQFLAPDFFGNPTTLNYWGEWNYGEFVGYVGIVPLLFAALAFTKKDRESAFWKIVLLGSLVFLLPNPVAKLPYKFYVPFISALQPTRLMVLVSFSLAVLAAFGLDRFLKFPKKSVVAVVLVFFFLIGGLWAYTSFSENVNLAVAKRNLILPTLMLVGGSVLTLLWRSYPLKRFSAVLLICIVGLMYIDLLRFGWKFTPFTDTKYFFPKTAVIDFLQNQKKPFRVASTDERILPPNVSAYFGIESIEGYDPIIFKRYEEFVAASERGKPDTTPPYGFNRIVTPHSLDSPLVPLFNARYILSLADLHKTYLKKVFQEGETRIYEDARALSRVYFVEEVRQEKSGKDVLNRMFNPMFDPRKTALVEQPVPVLAVPLSSSEAIEIDQYTDGNMTLSVQAENMRFMVISNISYPGWQANLDGKAVDIYRANYLFWGVVVPPGRHVITLQVGY